MSLLNQSSPISTFTIMLTEMTNMFLLEKNYIIKHLKTDMALVFPSSLFLEDQRLKGSKDDIMLSEWHNSCPSQDSNPPSMHLRYYYPSLLPVCWNQASTLNISSMDHAIFHGIIQPFEECIFLALMASHCEK